ncbi:MAG: zinc ABC transporter substrate-binding protein [Solobacterium sp.]|nr:zinc ABC transporter substrate-binding protein [Solobacterium sp.]
MKKLLTACLCLLICSACASEAQGADDHLTVVTTVWSAYDWCMTLQEGTENETVLLLDNGGDIHSFQPSVDDILKIRSADVFIYVGGESETWVDDVLKQVDLNRTKVIELLDVLDTRALEEENPEGAAAEEEEEENWYDEHVWLSLINASLLTQEIADTLAEADPEHERVYQQNCRAYLEQLNGLEHQYQTMAQSCSDRVILFADRFPFRYLAEDYDIKCYAAFAGCSAETEASFETVTFLTDRLDDLGLDCVLVLEESDEKLAKTIINASKDHNQKILTLHSMQKLTSRDRNDEVTYLNLMKENLEVLKEAMHGE